MRGAPSSSLSLVMLIRLGRVSRCRRCCWNSIIISAFHLFHVPIIYGGQSEESKKLEGDAKDREADAKAKAIAKSKRRANCKLQQVARLGQLNNTKERQGTQQRPINLTPPSTCSPACQPALLLHLSHRGHFGSGGSPNVGERSALRAES